MYRKLKPKILLIGAGRFGCEHLRVLKKLEKLDKIILEGVVVKTAASRKFIQKTYAVPVFTKLSRALLKRVDAVDIVTPIKTHFQLVKKCLAYTNVLAEKPLTTNYKQALALTSYAKERERILMVAHSYRFHPVTERLRLLLKKNQNELPYLIKGQFINPKNTDPGEDPCMDMLHFFDVIDFLFEKTPEATDCRARDRLHTVSLRYEGGMDAVLELGWSGDQKIRLLDLFFKDEIVHCDFLANTIDIRSGETVKHLTCKQKIEPLEKELQLFVDIQSKKSKQSSYPDAAVGARIVRIAENTKHQKTKDKPRVAIIGAGLFGTNCALALAKFADITIFERNDTILSEASFVNQYRHHWGYHYPRSPETVHDIKEAMASFESLYEPAIIHNFPTYYGIAKEGSKVSAEEYIRFCEIHKLPFTLEYPDSEFLNKEKIAVSLKTWEPIYDYARLKSLIQHYLDREKNILVKFNHNVTSGKLLPDGKKELTIQPDGAAYTETFDYCINVTYANHNVFPDWFGFPKKPVRVDLVEALIVRLPIPRISLAVMDGPFTNLVPTGEENIFTLVHIKESILKRFVPANGLIPPGLQVSSNAKNIIEKSREWFPVLEDAEYLESRYVFCCVNAYREYDDARPSDITRYGFGCFSILGGKILNCVSTAEEIAQEIKNYTYANSKIETGAVMHQYIRGTKSPLLSPQTENATSVHLPKALRVEILKNQSLPQ